MRKLYREHFYVPKKGEGVISEKVLMTRIAISVLFVLLILAQMGIAAYAHFLNTKETSRRPIFSATYDLDCKVKINGETSIANRIIANESLTYPITYEVELFLGDENTATTGFCIVTVDYLSTVVTENGEETSPQPPDVIYHTQQIGKDIHAQDGERNKLTFKIMLQSPATVRFVSNWGTSSNYDYDNTDLESYIEDGAQKIGTHVYGQSITDPCLGWEKSEALILEIADHLG